MITAVVSFNLVVFMSPWWSAILFRWRFWYKRVLQEVSRRAKLPVKVIELYSELFFFSMFNNCSFRNEALFIIVFLCFLRVSHLYILLWYHSFSITFPYLKEKLIIKNKQLSMLRIGVRVLKTFVTSLYFVFTIFRILCCASAHRFQHTVS